MMLDLKNNLLTSALASLIAALALVGLVMFLVLGRVNLDRIEPVGDTSVAVVAVASPQTGLEVFEEYNEILRRPVFFSDRRLPVLQSADFEPESLELVQEDPDEEEPVPELKASLAGIIITPDMRMAMIRDQAANHTLILREGMSLEGEQAAWRLDRIEPRMVNFVAVDGRSAGLELEVNTRGLTRPASSRPAPTPVAAAAEAPDSEEDAAEPAQIDDAARTRAEEIRRRVAERRAELRAEAERRAQQQQDN